MFASIANLLLAKGSTGTGSSVAIAPETAWKPLAVEVFGTFVGTVVLEGTIATQSEVNAATAVWLPITGASWTVPVLASVTVPFTHVRAKVTAWTSGAISVKAI